MKAMEYNYSLTNTGQSSSRYGNCEVCREHCSEVWHQVETRNYQIGNYQGQTFGGCRDLWGHKECLESKQKGS